MTAFAGMTKKARHQALNLHHLDLPQIAEI